MFRKVRGRTLAFCLATVILAGFTVSPVGAEKEKSEPQYPAQRLDVGDAVPEISFKDIEGAEGTSADYSEWVIVYSFADRKSNKPMMEWMEDAQIDVVRDHPELKIAFLSIADVAMVPSAFRYIVRPILRQINSSATKKLWTLYEEKGIDLDAVSVEFRMIPDWKGDHLKVFGLEDAKDYKVYITHRSRVLSFFDPNTTDKKEKFYRSFHELALSLRGEEPKKVQDPKGKGDSSRAETESREVSLNQ